MLFGGDFQAGVYENGGKVDTKLSVSEVEKIAKATANAIGSNFSVTKGSVDTGTFDLDFKGEKYGGGSYLIMQNGDVVNVALRGRPIYYNYKTKKKLEFGGDFQAGVYERGGYFDGAIPKTSTYMTNFAMGGSLQAHGIKEGDTFLTTISGVIQKVKDKNGKIVYVNLANGERDTQPPLPFNRGGSVTNERLHVNKDEDYEVRYSKPRPARKGYKGLRNFKTGGALVGNQKRIDMNKNGKIDAEDFKLLRSSMDGAWRNERKHVNHSEDYEVRYAKPRPSRTGYKGKRNFGEGGGISKFERLSRVVAKNYEGKRVKPQYQKEYGKVYNKSEAKEVGNKVAGKMKMMKKAESGAEVKKGNRGGVMVLAKKIRKEGESWKDALKRAGQQLK